MEVLEPLGIFGNKIGYRFPLDLVLWARVLALTLLDIFVTSWFGLPGLGYNILMSRLIVKNIPTNITEAQLKKIFEAKGEVTDVKIIFKGTQNRRFCFVGFKNAPDAEKA